MIVKRSFLARYQETDLLKNQMAHQLILAWVIILGGCLIAFWNWYFLGHAEGDYSYPFNGRFIGWSQSFFVNTPGLIVLNSVRWATHFMKAVGTILAGLFLSRVSHKRAVSVAFGFILLSFPLLIIALPFPGNSLTLVDVKDSYDLTILNPYNEPCSTPNALLGYFLFTFFRSFLFVGAGILVVCTQPILSRLRKITMIRSTRWNSLAFYGGFIVATAIFLFGSSLTYLLVRYWFVFSFLLIALATCLLLTYLIFGQDLRDETDLIATFHHKNDPLVAVKNINTWILALLFGFLTFIVLFPTSSGIKGLIQASMANLAIIGEDKIFFGDWQLSFDDVWKLWQIFFALGGVIGYFVIASFSHTNYERRNFLVFASMLGFMFLSISIVFGYSGYNYPVRLCLHFLFVFLSGIFLWGAESIILTFPHELEENNTHQISSTTGLMLGVASLLFMFIDCSFSSISDLKPVHPCANLCGTYSSSINILIFGSFLSSIFFILFFIWILPSSGTHLGNNFYRHKKPWRIWNWNFSFATFRTVDSSLVKP